ncbi:SDR family NAD(P)-dependent oxidoreductase [Dactylosporangium sp. NPDC048998]|uniref:type I polyketide synthase n=1 Tax=Dactylosporangium sp. NPDC048998 TaxID=3363976 RepID=UPI00371800C6
MSTDPPAVAPPDAVAIVGLACRFPGAPDAATFWRNLVAGREGITVRTRAELAALGVAADRLADPRFVPAGGVLDGLDLFDAEYFGIPPRDAALMDPQHRVFLECAVTALEDAGQVPGRVSGDVGVYAAAGFNSYLTHRVLPHAAQLGDLADMQWLAAGDKDYLATQTAYRIGLTGPAVSVQTACSSALVAVHLAGEALLSGECDLALAGAVSAGVLQGLGYRYTEGGILSPDGHCRPYDAAAGGTVFGGGVGVVVLKRLADALADGDQVRAVLLGSAVNNDGNRKVGFTAPSVDGQARVIAAALSVAGVHPEQVSYLEGHGTATALGDRVELAALRRVFAAAPDPNRVLGSVKSNVGHLDTCAGMAGLIKTVLCLQHRALVPTVHFEQPGPDLDADLFRVLTDSAAWPGADGARIAGVSAFGVGGTNAHVVLADPPPAARTTGRTADTAAGHGWRVLPLSARTPVALDRLTELTAVALRAPDAPALADAAHTLQTGRGERRWRRAAVARDGMHPTGLWTGGPVRAADAAPGVVFALAGQGSGHPGLAGGIHRDEPVFREALRRCLAALRPWTDAPVEDLLLDAAGGAANGDGFDRTEYAQPALFALEYALATWWIALGVRPVALIGHSIGELTAACLAEVFTLADAARLVAARARLMSRLPAGAMLAVPLSEAALRERLDHAGAAADGIDLAAVNAPERCVLAGAPQDVARIAEHLSALGVPSRPLATRHAFHSRHTDPLAAQFAQLVAGVPAGAPTLPVYSTLTGRRLTAAEAASPGYWAGQMRHTVRFADALDATPPGTPVLEIGPGRALSAALRQGWPDRPVLASLDPAPPADPGAEAAPPARYVCLARLWERGTEVRWAALGWPTGRRVSLPTYPFEPTRHWFEPATTTAPPPVGGVAVDDWLHVLEWKPTPPVRPAPSPPTVLVLLDRAGTARPALGPVVVASLLAAGSRTVAVEPGDPLDDPQWSAALLTRLANRGEPPDAIVDLRALDCTAVTEAGSIADLAGEARTCLAGLLGLHRAVGEVLPGRPVRTLVVTDAAHGIGGHPPRTPQAAAVLGAVRVVPLESPAMSMTAFDLDLAARDGDSLTAAAAAVIAELGAGSDAMAAARGRSRLVPVPARPVLAPSGPAPVPPGGVHLITGGLGGVGLAVAGHLAADPGRTLLLLGRRPVPDGPGWHTIRPPGAPAGPGTPELAEALDALTAAGATVCLVHADVTDADALAGALRQARARFGRIVGVVHAAGVADGVVSALRTAQQLDRVLAAKVAGTLLLHRLTAPDRPEYLVLCSSVLAVTGAAGQAGYVAANAFLDSFAHLADRTVSIGWDRWSQTGMAVRAAGDRETGPQDGWPDDGQRLEHPLFDARRDSADGTCELRLRWHGHTRWLADEHRLRGEPVLPGTALLDLAVAGYRLLHGPGAVQLDAVFAQPLRVPEGTSPLVVFRLRPRPEGGYEWEAGGSAVAARGGIGPHAGTAGPLDVAPPADVALPVTGYPEPAAGAAAGAHTAGLRTGPRWRCLTGGWADQRAAVLRMDLPERFHADLDAHPLHPALLDVATGAVAGAGGAHLPAAYRRVVVYRDLPAAGYARVVRQDDAGDADTLVVDVTLADPDGQVAVEVTGFVLRPPAAEPGGLTTADALRAFDRVLANRHLPHVLVTTRGPAPAPAPRRPHPAAAPPPAAPGPADGDTGDLARLIADASARLLGVAQVGRDDSIFQLGADSLLIVQLAAELQRLGVAVSPGDIFAEPTAARLAAHLSAGRPQPVADAVAPDAQARHGFADTDLDETEVARIMARFQSNGDQKGDQR